MSEQDPDAWLANYVNSAYALTDAEAVSGEWLLDAHGKPIAMFSSWQQAEAAMDLAVKLDEFPDLIESFKKEAQEYRDQIAELEEKIEELEGDDEDKPRRRRRLFA